MRIRGQLLQNLVSSCRATANETLTPVAEEDAVGLTSAVPFALETTLAEAGGIIEKGADWCAPLIPLRHLFVSLPPRRMRALHIWQLRAACRSGAVVQ